MTINASRTDGHSIPCVLIYDARGNGGGAVSPTITGGHQDRITDYTAIVVRYEEAAQPSEVNDGICISSNRGICKIDSSVCSETERL